MLERLGLDAAAATSWSARTARRTSTPRRGCGMLLDCLRARPRRRGACRSWCRPTRAPASASRRWTAFDELEGIDFHEPFGFHDYNQLQTHGCVRAVRLRHDRGGVLDPRLPGGDAARLDRASRGADTGSIIMTGLDKVDVLGAVETVMQDFQAVRPSVCRPATKSSTHRLVPTVSSLSTAGRYAQWTGLRS